MSTETLTKPQLIAINVLVGKLKIGKDGKELMIQGFTNGRETSSSKLTKEEAALVISHLKSFDPDEKKADKMRKKIISMAHELGWHQQGTRRIDMKRINEWCRQQFGKKGIDNYTLKELPKLVSIFEMVYSQFMNNLKK